MELSRWRSAFAEANAMRTGLKKLIYGWRIASFQRLRRLYATAWHSAYIGRSRMTMWFGRRGRLAGWMIVVILIGSLLLSAPSFERSLQAFGDKEHLPSLQQFLVTLGGALIGAATIAFSLVMFAMQINVDRMPYGLFRKLSSDLRLLAAFVSTFALATGIASLSLFVGQTGVARVFVLTACGTVLVLFVFLYAYRRALNLISPYEQLSIVIRTADTDLQRWVRRAKRAEPLFSEVLAAHKNGGPEDAVGVDVPRMMFFKINFGWTAEALEALQYASAFARRFAERGDYEVASAALNAIVAINASYIKAKGKTFFATNYLVDSLYTTDSFINDTLEYLRQNVEIGLSRGDERQVEETFRAMASLAQMYLKIDYANEWASKTHAHLAAEYLSSAVQAAAPHNIPDVLMKGLRFMGAIAQQMLLQSTSDAVATSSEKITLISAVGVVKADHIPVTTCGVEQLTQLTLSLIRSTSRSDHNFAISELRDDVFSLAMLIVEKMRDAPLFSPQSAALASYFSVTSMQSLPALLTNVVNALSDAAADNDQAQRVVDNLEDWAESLYDPYKKLLLAAIAKRSHLTFDLIHWASHITKLLLVVSCSRACGDHAQDELRKSALWLIYTLSWVPSDRETVTYIENFHLADVLFETAVDAYRWECVEVAEEVFKLLVDWGFKAGLHQTGWASLETALCGAAALCALGVVSRSELMASVEAHLRRQGALEQETRFRAARKMQDTAKSLDQRRHALSKIDSALGKIDPVQLRPLLEGVAAKLIPEQGEQNQ